MIVNLHRHTHISNYKKALVSIFDKKKIWEYLKEGRKVALKEKKRLSTRRSLAPTDDVIYH